MKREERCLLIKSYLFLRENGWLPQTTSQHISKMKSGNYKPTNIYENKDKNEI